MTSEGISIKRYIVGIWSFIIPSNARHCGDAKSELLELCSKLYGCFEDFIVPLEVEFSLQQFPEDAVIPISEEGSGEDRMTSETITVTVEDGGPETSIIEMIEASPSDTYIPGVKFNHSKLRMRLDGSDVLVDRYTHYYEYEAGGRTGRKPYYDPCRFK